MAAWPQAFQAQVLAAVSLQLLFQSGFFFILYKTGMTSKHRTSRAPVYHAVQDRDAKMELLSFGGVVHKIANSSHFPITDRPCTHPLFLRNWFLKSRLSSLMVQAAANSLII